jgi:hypothetical protein
LEKGSGSERALILDRHLSPALSSTFCGGEGDKSSRWDRLDKADVNLRPALENSRFSDVTQAGGTGILNLEPLPPAPARHRGK